MNIDTQTINLLRSLVSQGGLILFFAFLFTRIGFFRQTMMLQRASIHGRIVFIIYFSIIGIIGTYTGIPIMGALANARVVGVFVGGLIGGPVVGISTGIIAGFHRWAIDIGGFTAFACMLSTITEGLLAGLLSSQIRKFNNKWIFAAIWGAAAELIQMGIILLIAKPFPEALELVRIIALPMILGNAVGIGMFIAVTEDTFREAERIAVRQSHLVLSTARETIQYLRTGLTSETALAVVEIILKNIMVSAVSISDTEKCLAFKGVGEDHHLAFEPLKTKLTREVIADGIYRVARQKEDIGCVAPDCPLSSALIVPLKVKGITVGTLKLYRSGRREINPVDVEVGLGLATLFSTQIEVSELQRQSELLATAELQALQSQIRPHFLFNTLNAVTSLIRTKPQQARELLISLGELLRRSLGKAPPQIPLEEELYFIKSYLEIEKVRFEDKLKVEYRIDVPPGCMLPPLTLQPIIENAVIHGIGSKVGNGIIIISGEKKDGGVIFSVEDNGPGMDSATIRNVLNRTDSGDHIGLRNVNERLDFLYGSRLDIESSPGKGSKVSFFVPIADKTEGSPE
ncbi:MAG: histidine kinase [Spirochaetales bacterium]|nr:histidine kinase [Spirochaetales bacterium]